MDGFDREVDYLRISVTDRCNLRCFYCRPATDKTPAKELLTNRELLRIIRAATKAGIKRVRLTGGEPLVRQGIVDLAREINLIPGIKEYTLTTNGILLPDYIGELKKAGLQRVNISLDTLQAARYKNITRTGNLQDVLKGIDSALAAGLEPVKINTVLIRGVNDDEITELARLTMDYPLHVRFIELMPIGEGAVLTDARMIPTEEIRLVLEEKFGGLANGGSVMGSGPASYCKLPGSKGTIGFISALSNCFCAKCNRIRLTASGGLRPCLYSPEELDIAGFAANGSGEEELVSLIRRAIVEKPKRHHMENGGTGDDKLMSQIGG